MEEKTTNLQIHYDASKQFITLISNGNSTTFTVKQLYQIYNLKETFTNIINNSVQETQLFVPPYQTIPVSPSKRVSPKMRDQLWYEYYGTSIEGICWACNEVIIQGSKWHASHVTAASKGGPTEITNLRPCCQSCNLRMNNQNLYAFIEQQGMNGPGSLQKDEYFKLHPGQRHDVISRISKPISISSDNLDEWKIEALRSKLIEMSDFDKNIILTLNKRDLILNLQSIINGKDQVKEEVKLHIKSPKVPSEPIRIPPEPIKIASDRIPYTFPACIQVNGIEIKVNVDIVIQEYPYLTSIRLVNPLIFEIEDDVSKPIPDTDNCYIIRFDNTNHCNIGHSLTPENEILKLQTGPLPLPLSLFACCPGNVEIVKHYHDTYKDKEGTNKWFNLDEEIITRLQKEFIKMRITRKKEEVKIDVPFPVDNAPPPYPVSLTK